MERKTPLTREEVLAIQDALIAEYDTPEFQEQLQAKLAAAGDNHAKQVKARREMCLPIQAKVISKYGFEPTEKGVIETYFAMTDDLRADPAIITRDATMCALVELDAGSLPQWKSWPTREWGPGHSPRQHSPRQEKPGAKPPMTRFQVVYMLDHLIEAYQKQDFQDKLHAALAAAGGDRAKQMKARHKVCLPIQAPILLKWGFEPTLAGVQQAFGGLPEELRKDPEIAAKFTTAAVLVDEDLHPHVGVERERDAKGAEDVDAAALHKHPAVHVEPAEGRFWKVVGGAHIGDIRHHGVVVRKGRELSSPLLWLGGHEARLSTGAVVTELELDGERLHYQKVTGDGPDFGWVSIGLHGQMLLEPVADPPAA